MASKNIGDLKKIKCGQNIDLCVVILTLRYFILFFAYFCYYPVSYC